MKSFNGAKKTRTWRRCSLRTMWAAITPRLENTEDSEPVLKLKSKLEVLEP
jgi:hypothetical protein